MFSGIDLFSVSGICVAGYGLRLRDILSAKDIKITEIQSALSIYQLFGTILVCIPAITHVFQARL